MVMGGDSCSKGCEFESHTVYWMDFFTMLKFNQEGRGCGSVGRVVASAPGGSQFKPSHQQNFVMNILTVVKTKIYNKFLKKNLSNGFATQ